MLPNLIKHQWPDVDKIYLYFKDSFESKNHLLNNGIEKVGNKELNNAKAFIYYSQTLADFYEYIKDYNSARKRDMLIVSDDMIADI